MIVKIFAIIFHPWQYCIMLTGEGNGCPRSKGTAPSRPAARSDPNGQGQGRPLKKYSQDFTH